MPSRKNPFAGSSKGTKLRAKVKVKLTPEQLKQAEDVFVKFTESSLNEILQDKFEDFKELVGERIRDRISKSTVWRSLESGHLNELLEINNSQSVLTDILEGIADNAEIKFVKVKASGKAFFGGFSVKLLNESFQEVTDPVQNEKGLNRDFNWVKTMLFAGDDHAIFNFGLNFQNEATTLAEAERDILQYFNTPLTANVFIKQKPIEPRGVLKIPAEFQGTAGDNFITRSLEGIEKDIEEIFELLMKGADTVNLEDFFGATTDRADRIGGE